MWEKLSIFAAIIISNFAFSMAKQPMAEVFGFPIKNDGKRAEHFRKNKLCPFGNVSPNCTKDKANSPLGVCSVLHNDDKVITCPVRFREDWIIIENAAKFAFPENTCWTSLSEIKLLDANGQSAGNIDYVVVSYDPKSNKIIDFASVEVQGVYISGNLRNAFEEYIKSPNTDFEWNGRNYPHPDYLSSSRKRLVPQMLYKGGIFKSWGKKQCVVIQESFYKTLPNLPEVPVEEADIAWFLYDLVYDTTDNQYHLELVRTIYTEFSQALNMVITPKAGSIKDFYDLLQNKFDTRQNVSPDTPKTILDIL